MQKLIFKTIFNTFKTMKNIILFFSIFLFGACQEKNITEEIAKSPKISAEVDGKLREGTAEAYFSKGMLHIDTWDGWFGIDLHLESPEVGEYLLGQNQYNEATVYPMPPLERIATSSYDTSTYGKVVITAFDKKDSIITGSFEFIALNSSGEVRTRVKNGKFENIKIIKNDRTFLNKMSFKINSLETKFRENGVTWDNNKNIIFGGQRWIRSEALSVRLPDSIVRKGSHVFSVADTAIEKLLVVYIPKMNTPFFETLISGKIDFIKMDSINRIIQAKFNFELKGYNNKKVIISDGFFDAHY